LSDFCVRTSLVGKFFAELRCSGELRDRLRIVIKNGS